jgi:transcriptional regulator with PAS, ATPase and Fis domain
MDNFDWAKEFPGAVTVCDSQGIIVYMNDKSEATFEGDGGRALIGQNLFGCHSADSNHKIEEIMRTRQPNIYTIEKKGVKKLIYQAPLYQEGQFSGLVELSLEIPFEMPHFLRG